MRSSSTVNCNQNCTHAHTAYIHIPRNIAVWEGGRGSRILQNLTQPWNKCALTLLYPQGGPEFCCMTHLQQHCVDLFLHTEVILWEEFSGGSSNSNVCTINASNHPREAKFGMEVIRCLFLPVSIWPRDEFLQLLDNNVQQIIDTPMITGPCETKSVTQQPALSLMCQKVQHYENLILQVHSTSSTSCKNSHTDACLCYMISVPLTCQT